MKIKIKETKKREAYSHYTQKPIKFNDKRTKRLRTRAAQKQQAIREY